MTIKVLDPKTIARIAAGEVVERPASVVKELVENALDAGATQISVETRDGGVAYLRVTDNGSGIVSAEVETAFQRHATSKLQRIEDLETIFTLGFRGEALPSIAAVAEVELTTATNGAPAGDYLHLQDGQIVAHTAQARPPGTSLTVKNLFRNVPARLKFLKSTATESGHVANIVTQYALAYPEVKFSLQSEGRTVLQTAGDDNLLTAVMAVYGLETAKNMVNIRHEDNLWKEGEVSQIKVGGLVSSPVISRAGKDAMHFYINRRAINSRILTFAVEEAYSGLLMQGRHPVAVINVEIPPAQVDVNIHPTKSEVKFQDDRSVFTAVQRAVRAALVKLAPVPQIAAVSGVYHATRPGEQSAWKLTGTVSPPVNASATGDEKKSLPPLRVLGQVGHNYIIAEGPDGIYIIDQHAAHERLAYEKIQKQWEKRQVETQGLMTPFTLEVSPRQAAALQQGEEEFTAFGFNLEPFGERVYLVRAVPAVLAAGDWLGAIREILEEPSRGDARYEAMMKSLACHSVVRAGQTLTDEEMRALVRQMEEAAQPFTCPHGRPTLINLTVTQLEKEFGRS
ncbi:MAG: DNA mismatch repair endonuclease MutL [Dehalococcoidales bacterium]|nr:DNA mismatch repair endonuclease MutL [Dehalococcoidales bacterium]